MNLSLSAIHNAYSQICMLQNPNNLVQIFEDCFRSFSVCNIGVSSNSIKAAGQKLLNLSNALKEIKFEISISALNSKQFAEYREGIEFIREVQSLNTPASLKNLILKIQTAAKAFFPTPDQVTLELVRERDLLLSKWETTKMCQGLVELYELTTRPYLPEQQSIQDAVVPVLASLKKLISSFAESNKIITEQEGKAMLKKVSILLANHKDQFRDLCAKNSFCPKLIDDLVSVSQDELKIQKLYSALKDGLIECCRGEENSNTIKPEDLIEFFQEKAKIAFSALPADLKPDTRALGQRLAAAFKTHQDHGNGVLVSGQESLSSSQGQYFGSGFNGAIPEHTQPIDPFNSMSRDSIENLKAQEKIKEISKSIVKNYYQNNKLIELRFIINGSVINQEPIYDPIEQALATVHFLIQYELSQHVEKNGLLFGLDENRKQLLMPEISKKIIIFGINHDMFFHEQVELLIHHYKISADAEVLDAIHAALIRRFQRTDFRLEKSEEKKLP